MSISNKTGGSDSGRNELQKIRLHIDEAIAKAKFGRFNYILIFMSSMALFASLVEVISITFVFPVSQCDLNLNTSEKGILGAAGFFGIICSSYLWGFLADTKGRRQIIQPTLCLAFLMTVISSFLQNFYLLTAFRFLNGFFISGSSATIFVYLGEFHSNSQRSRAIMGSSVIFGVLCILMPLVAWGVINQDWQYDVPFINVTYKPWRLFMVICGLPELIAFVIITYLPESPKFVLSQGNQTEAKCILQRVNKMNDGINAKLEWTEIYGETESIDDNDCKLSIFESAWNQIAPLFKPPHLLSTVLICFIQFSIFFTCQGLNVFYADILNKMALHSNARQKVMMCNLINMHNETQQIIDENNEMCTTKLETITLLLSIILQVLYTFGYFVVGLLINRVSRFPILFSILCGTGACGIACMLVENSLLQVSLFTVLIASGVASNILNTATIELYPTNLRAMALCLSLMIGRLGSMSGSNIAALLLEKHCESAFYLSGITLIVAASTAYFIPNIQHKGANKLDNP